VKVELPNSQDIAPTLIVLRLSPLKSCPVSLIDPLSSFVRAKLRMSPAGILECELVLDAHLGWPYRRQNWKANQRIARTMRTGRNFRSTLE
jgi:hypothetical protein